MVTVIASTYIGQIGRTLEKRISKHKAAVKRHDEKNGIAVHAWNKHRVDWQPKSYKWRQITPKEEQLKPSTSISNSYPPILTVEVPLVPYGTPSSEHIL